MAAAVAEPKLLVRCELGRSLVSLRPSITVVPFSAEAGMPDEHALCVCWWAASWKLERVLQLLKDAILLSAFFCSEESSATSSTAVAGAAAAALSFPRGRLNSWKPK